MTFDAQRDTVIRVAEGAPGLYTLTTDGLHRQGRPELEITGVPEVAAKAVAANVVNDLADYTVNRAEVKHGQYVTLTKRLAGSTKEPLVFALKALWGRPPSGGIVARLTGKADRGVLRIVHPAAESADAVPLTLLASAMVHRAEALALVDRAEEALAELEAAIQLYPGEPTDGPRPRLEGVDGDDNWQNRTAYRRWTRLAAKLGGDVYPAAFARCAPLAERKLGATLAAIAALDEVRPQVAAIVAANLAAYQPRPGPTEELVIYRSPLWEPGGSGESRIGLTMLPRGFEESYYAGDARRALESGALVDAVAEAVAAHRHAPWRLLPLVDLGYAIYGDEAVPVAPAERRPGNPSHLLASALLADGARCVRAGMTVEMIRDRFADPQAAASPEAAERIAALEAWEAERYVAAVVGR